MKRTLLLNDPSLTRVRVYDIVEQDGWQFNDIEVKPVQLGEGLSGLELSRDSQRLATWKLYEQENMGKMPPLRNKEDGSFKCNCSPPLMFYVIGSDGKKYRYLYFQRLPNGQFRFGNRNEIGARYPSNCMSRRQRKENVDLQILRLIRRKRWLRFERKLQKRLRGDPTSTTRAKSTE